MRRPLFSVSKRALLIALVCACTSSDNPNEPGTTTGTISGVVTDAITGAPLSGAVISTQPPTNTVTANAQGAYTIANVQIGSYSITATHTAYNPNSTNAVVVAGLTVTANLNLTPQGGSIAGVVTDATTGAPVSGASVSTQPPTSSVSTNAQGAYTISGAASGTYTVNASRSGYAPNSVQVTVMAGQTATAGIALTPLPGTLSGTVTDAASGAPIAGASVTTQPATTTAITNSQGAFTISGVPAGSYNVTASHAGYSPGSANGVVGPGQAVTVNIALAPVPGTISGVITNASNGAPIAGATVSTVPPTATVTTNAQGSYTIPNVPPGTYTVNATSAGFNPNSAPAAVTSSQVATTDIALTPLPGGIMGVVTDASNGAPIAGATVTTVPATSSVTTNAQGAYTIQNVPPGTYTVTATRSGYSPGSGPATVLPGQTATRDISLSTQPAYDGSWTGTLSDGRTMSFTIANSAFTQFSTQFAGAACGISGDVTINYTIPLPISGNAFTISSNGGPPVRIAFTFNGTFTSGTTASGTATFTITISPPIGSCTTSYNVTWTAIR
ncbi:MAG TPA: carboxypeptidase regulatory-like domain-containing protein [Gemmatimonadaceae bacterium]